MKGQGNTHHLGIKVPDMDIYRLVVEVLTGFMTPLEAPAPDHERTYFELCNAAGEPTGVFLEIQCWNDGKWGVHIDAIEQDPRGVADSIAAAVVSDVIPLEGEPQAIVPVAGLFSIMTRSVTGGAWRPGPTRQCKTGHGADCDCWSCQSQ